MAKAMDMPSMWLVLLPIALPIIATMVLFLTPSVRPLTIRQLLFTYVVPLIPIFYAWDGLASNPRIYTVDDLDELIAGIDSEGYRWERGEAEKPGGGKLGLYLLGLPSS